MTKKSKKSDKPDAFAELLETLSPRALADVTKAPRHPLTPVQDVPRMDAEHDDFEQTCDMLSERARQQVDVPETTEEPLDVQVDAAKFCIIESPDGDFARLHGYTTPQQAATRLGELEGQDIVVHVVYGIPLRLTIGPQRFLTLPDGQQAIMIPTYPGGPTKVVDANLVEDMEIQDDGFLGPPELVNTPQVPEKPKKKKKKANYGPDDDDDDDDEDEDEEAEA